MALQVHDPDGRAYNVLLRIDAKAAQGTLVMTARAVGDTQQHELTQLQKSRDGKTLMCKVGTAAAALTIVGWQLCQCRRDSRLARSRCTLRWCLSLTFWIKSTTVIVEFNPNHLLAKGCQHRKQ